MKQQPSGRLVIDRAKVTAEERLDGKYLLSTSNPDLTPEDIALGYKNLLEAERGFRDLKSTLELRPVHHHLEPRIRAHVLLCWLALLLIRVAERSTNLTWRRIAIELGRVHAVTLTGTAGSVVHATPLNTTQTGILAACKVTPPPTVTTLTPARQAQTVPRQPRGHVGTRPHTPKLCVRASQPANSRCSSAHQLRNPGPPRVARRWSAD